MPHPFARPRTRSIIAGIVAIAMVLLVGVGAVVAATRAVTISDFAFSPRTITINVGDRVRWTNTDAIVHTATATSGAFDTGDLGEGESASVRFTVPGTYRYVCTPHPTMTGTIRVRATSSGSGLPATDTTLQLGPAEPGAGADSGPVSMPALLVAATAVLVGLSIARRRRSA
jgi:plastocyanin